MKILCFKRENIQGADYQTTVQPEGQHRCAEHFLEICRSIAEASSEKCLFLSPVHGDGKTSLLFAERKGGDAKARSLDFRMIVFDNQDLETEGANPLQYYFSNIWELIDKNDSEVDSSEIIFREGSVTSFSLTAAHSDNLKSRKKIEIEASFEEIVKFASDSSLERLIDHGSDSLLISIKNSLIVRVLDPDYAIFTRKIGLAGSEKQAKSGNFEPETPVKNCSRCQSPMVLYRSDWVCRQCANNDFVKDKNLRKGIDFASRLSIFGFVLSILGVIGIAGDMKSSQLQIESFWILLMLPAAGFAAMITLGFTRNIAFRREGVAKAPRKWFSSDFMMRDLSIIALIILVAYVLAVFILKNRFGAVDQAIFPDNIDLKNLKAESLVFIAKNFGRWFLARGIPLWIIVSGSLAVLAKLEWIGTISILPKREDSKTKYILLFGLMSSISFLFIQRFIVYPLSKIYKGTSIFTGGVLLFIIGLVWYVISYIFLIRERKKNENSIVYPATIAVVGPTESGKTVFLAMAYRMMRDFGALSFRFRQSPEGSQVLAPAFERISQRQWPDQTANANEIPFEFIYKIRPVMHFKWLELPGAAFLPAGERPSEYQSQRDQFDLQLENSDGVVMIIPAPVLWNAVQSKAKTFKDKGIYRDIISQYYNNKSEVILSPVPLAIIITQSCRIEARHWPKMRSLVEDIRDEWISLADPARKPKAEIFFSSAVVTPPDSAPPVGKKDFPQEPNPIESRNCHWPLLWIASQIMRSHVGLLEGSMGMNRKAPLHEMILDIEAEAQGELF